MANLIHSFKDKIHQMNLKRMLAFPEITTKIIASRPKQEEKLWQALDLFIKTGKEEYKSQAASLPMRAIVDYSKCIQYTPVHLKRIQEILYLSGYAFLAYNHATLFFSHNHEKKSFYLNNHETFRQIEPLFEYISIPKLQQFDEFNPLNDQLTELFLIVNTLFDFIKEDRFSEGETKHHPIHLQKYFRRFDDKYKSPLKCNNSLSLIDIILNFCFNYYLFNGGNKKFFVSDFDLIQRILKLSHNVEIIFNEELSQQEEYIQLFLDHRDRDQFSFWFKDYFQALEFTESLNQKSEQQYLCYIKGETKKEYRSLDYPPIFFYNVKIRSYPEYEKAWCYIFELKMKAAPNLTQLETVFQEMKQKINPQSRIGKKLNSVYLDLRHRHIFQK